MIGWEPYEKVAVLSWVHDIQASNVVMRMIRGANGIVQFADLLHKFN